MVIGQKSFVILNFFFLFPVFFSGENLGHIIVEYPEKFQILFQKSSLFSEQNCLVIDFMYIEQKMLFRIPRNLILVFILCTNSRFWDTRPLTAQKIFYFFYKISFPQKPHMNLIQCKDFKVISSDFLSIYLSEVICFSLLNRTSVWKDILLLKTSEKSTKIINLMQNTECSRSFIQIPRYTHYIKK